MRPAEPVIQQVKHLVVVPVRVAWHKARWRCGNTGCARPTFAEAGSLTVAGGRVSGHAKKMMGHLAGDWLVPVSRVAGGAGVAWHTAHDGFAQVAADARIVVTDTKTSGISTGDGDGDSGGDGGPGTGGDDAAVSGSIAGEARAAARGHRSVSGVLPRVQVLGIDDHRRGRALYHRDGVSGVWVADADRWQSVFVDSAGGHGLLGQVEGRAGVDVRAWPAEREPAWLAAVKYVTIDMSSVYKSAVRGSGLLPNAKLIVDLFHVIQLAKQDGLRRAPPHHL